MADTQLFVQNQQSTLAGAGAAIGDATIVLSSLTQNDGTALAMTDVGTKGYATIEPGNGTQEESITFSGITQNGDGTATLTGVKSALTVAPYTESAGLTITHAGGTILVLTNTAAFYNALTGKGNDETITGVYTFPNGANRPRVDTDSDTVITEGFITLGQLSRQAISGASNMSLTVKGIGEEATQAEIDAGTQAGATSAELVVNPKYLKDSIYYTQLPSSDQKAALAGTSGTPSTSNKYVTGADAPGTGDVIRNSVMAAALIVAEPDIQIFTSNGTYTMPAGATVVDVTLVGSGGSGGGGYATGGTNYSGGSGGGGAQRVRHIFRASDISSPVTVTIGPSQAGGATDTDGADGGVTTFGTYLTANGGKKGLKGAASTTQGGIGGGLATATTNGISGQAANYNAGDDGYCAEFGGASGGGGVQAAISKKGGSSLYGCGGGGSGGADNNTTAYAGGAGGVTNSYAAGGGAAGGTAGTPGTVGTAGAAFCGGGGGGGSTGSSNVGGVGGAGGIGGGGGGGGSSQSANGGAGGAGGAGLAIIVTYK